MYATTLRSPLMTYDEAAERLGIQRVSVKQLVTRGRLHSIPAPEDRRRRLLQRAEVEAYAHEQAGKWSYAAAEHPQAVQSTPLPPLSPELVLAGSTGVATAALLIKAFRVESDVALKLLILGAVIALALILLREWSQRGKVNAAQQRRLEKLAKQAETKPEVFLQEFEQVLIAQ
jgi:excisionase family DNA binding protein